MATTIICQQQQGLCLDSPLVEPIATLRLKLSSSSSITNHSEPSQQKCHFGPNNKDLNTITIKNHATSSSSNKGGWSFLQSLSTAASPATGGGEPAYVHPLNRRSSATILSERSLELCTEGLGNETGTTDTVDCGILSNTWCAGPKPAGVGVATVDGGERREMGRLVSARKRVRVAPQSFPPPLTTISGKDSVRVRSHREDGRLVITAVKEQSRVVSCFRADRSEEGRLRLCLLESYWPDFDSRESFENEVNETEKEEEEEEKEEEEEEEEEEGESEKEIGEMGIIEKFGMVRGGRCKEGGEKQYIVENKSVLNWEPFWVAT